MPLTSFRCSDGIQRPIAECLAKCPRKEGRCLSLPTLYQIGKDRPFTGKFSTTQLLNPTRQEYLKLTREYAINPKAQAFALLGTRHHQTLEAVAHQIKGIEVEKFLDGDTTGTLDLLEPEGDKWRLIDYKTWGSYSVAKIIYADNDGVYDKMQVSLQLNNYRIKAERLGFAVSSLLVQCTVRDGGTKTARENRIEWNMDLIPIPILPDKEVIDYFDKKREGLQMALANNALPEMCPFEERWGGRRCKGDFCPVHTFCPEGAKINKVKYLG